MSENIETFESNQEKNVVSEPDAAIGYMAEKNQDAFMEGNLELREIGRSFYKLAKVHYDKSDLELAERYFLKSLEFTERPRDLYAILKIYGFLIRIASEGMDNQKAELYISKAEERVEELTRALGTLNAEYFYYVGLNKNYRGLFAEAKENYELAHKKAHENEPDLLAKTLLALATNSISSKDYDKTLIHLEQLNHLLSILDKGYLKSAMHLFSGKVYCELGQFEKALDSYSEAMNHLQQKKCWNLYGYLLLGRGVVAKRMGDYEKSLTYFKLSQESVDQNQFRRLARLIDSEIQDVNDSSIDIYLDKVNRKVVEKTLGTIDFKHRFVLLEILFLLAKNPGIYFDKELLAKSVWKDEYNPLIHDKLIYTSVSRLRKLIEPKNNRGDKRKYIIRGKDGYTFNPRARIRFHKENKAMVSDAIANVELNSPV